MAMICPIAHDVFLELAIEHASAHLLVPLAPIEFLIRTPLARLLLLLLEVVVLVPGLNVLMPTPRPVDVPSSRQAVLLDALKTYWVVGLDPVLLIDLLSKVPALLPVMSIP